MPSTFTVTNDEAYRLRENDVEVAQRDSQAGFDSGGPSGPILAKTTTVTTYPTVAGSFFACIPQGVSGTEGEGNAGVFTAQSGVIYALNTGSAIPPSGTKVLLRHTDFRWVFRYDG